MQSFDNLETLQADMLTPYRFEKLTSAQPTGILMQAPSSSLLTMDPRVAQSGTTEESVDISDSSLPQKEKVFPVGTTTYTLAGKTPVICSSVGTLNCAVSRKFF